MCKKGGALAGYHCHLTVFSTIFQHPSPSACLFTSYIFSVMGIYTINHKCYITTATIFNALLPARELPTRNARVRNAPKIPCSCSCSCTAGTKLLICLCNLQRNYSCFFSSFYSITFYHNFFSFL